MKKNYLFLIILLGIFLRFNVDLFISGYNFDELAMVSIAKQAFPFSILKQSALLDYHAPLYYFVAHFFTFFQNEWIYLRFFNLIISLLNIIVFYLIGKELNNKKTGLILALFLAINHLNISTVSFVKFYCLCMFLVSLSILFFIKMLNNKKYYLTFGIINALYSISATLGIIFVFLEYLILLLVKKGHNIKLIKSLSISICGFLIYLPVLIIQTKTAFNNILSPHCAYSGVYLSEVYGILNDYISPLLNYCCNYDTVSANSCLYNFIAALSDNIYNYSDLFTFVIFSLIPVLMAIILNIISIKKNKINKLLFILGFLYFLALLLFVKLQILGLVTLYFYPFGLIFLILTGVGLSYINNKKIFIFLLSTFILLQILIVNTYPLNKRNSDKDKIYYCFEQYFKDNPENTNTIYIMTAGARFLEKYYADKNIFSFDYEQIGASHDRKFIKLIYGDDFNKNVTKENIIDLSRPIVLNKIKNPDFEKYVYNNIISKLNRGDKVIFIFNSDSQPYISNDKLIKKIYNCKKYNPYFLNPINLYKNDSMEYLVIDTSDAFEAIQTYSNLCLIEILEKYLIPSKVQQYIRNDKFEYEKKYEADKFNYSIKWLLENAQSGWVFVTYVKK